MTMGANQKVQEINVKLINVSVSPKLNRNLNLGICICIRG